MYAGPGSSNLLLARVSSFLPTIRAANEALVAAAAADGAGATEGTAVVVLDTDLQAVYEGGDTTSDDEDNADASSSSTSSSSEGSERVVINGPAKDADAATVDSSDDEESASAVSDEKKQARKKRKKKSSALPPTIVMDFQLGSFQDNATMALIARHDRSDVDDEGKDESEDDRTPRTDAESLVRNLLASKGTQPSKKLNGPLITEIAP